MTALKIDTYGSVGPDVRNILYHIAKLNLHREILEIGCLNGYSTSAFVVALDEGADFHLTLCDINIESSVLEMAAKHPKKITIRECRSEEVIDSSYDLIFVDGDHTIEVVGRELMLLLRCGTKTVIAHDTTSEWCPGAVLLKQVYDIHKNYHGKTLCNSGISGTRGKFLDYGTSFYSKDQAVIDHICRIKVLSHLFL